MAVRHVSANPERKTSVVQIARRLVYGGTLSRVILSVTAAVVRGVARAYSTSRAAICTSGAIYTAITERAAKNPAAVLRFIYTALHCASR